MTDIIYCKSAIIWIMLNGILVNSINGNYSNIPLRRSSLYRQVFEYPHLVLADDIHVDALTECSTFCLNDDCDGFAFCRLATSNCFLFSHGNSAAATNLSGFSTCSFYVASQTTVSAEDTTTTASSSITTTGSETTQTTTGSGSTQTTTPSSTAETSSGSTMTDECINFTGGGCLCPNGAISEDCSDYIEDCSDYPLGDGTRIAFLHIKPLGWKGDAFLVRCFSGLTIIHMRENVPSCHGTSFDLPWLNYSEGFGDIENGCFWLGNDKISEITKSNSYTMHVFTKIGSDLTSLIRYDGFKMESAVNKYRLRYATTDLHTNSDGFDGPGSDMDVKDQEFYTYDRDRNGCAAASGGGWWYGSGCAYGNLNNGTWPYWPVDNELSVLGTSVMLLFRDYQ